ncbi:aminotransferase class V-fold PLP-dependent enzyme [uncultured Alsobacter sp.]|uniref:pyridoxal-phosphate-dependent aminotransferase family protein n=1 Tax=uncultured Alsobacter sp. TaxID=1748258 RepID=UPI0025D57CEE|nr:aminotransferase class V-fold PLP-dependent enzyme [uncultured Alsobacter sp.]
MSLARGRHFQAIPGPSAMPDEVLSAMHRDAPNIYEGSLIDVTLEVETRLKAVARAQKAGIVIYITNGHGAWEGALINLFSPGDKVLALYTGRFARGWADMARAMRVEIEEIDFGARSSVDPQRVEDALRRDKSIKAVLMVQTDTASSVRNDVLGVRRAIDAAGSDALFLVDCIASLGCEPYEMDAWGVDVTVAASQKGLMTPPGIGLNYVGEKARRARKSAQLVTPYWDWEPRLEPTAFHARFCGTPPTHHLFGLHAALGMIEREGLENVWERHRRLSGAVHAAVEAWGKGGTWELNIPDPANRSWAVSAIRTGIDANTLRTYCDAELDLTLGVGISLSSGAVGVREAGLFRIGHMGHLNPPAILGTLATIEAAMEALRLERGPGAVEAAAKALVKG